jgi:hypothetical protein
MHIYYAVMIAAVVGAVIGAGAITALNAQSTPKAYIVTEVDVTGDMDVFQKDYAAYVQRRSIRSAAATSSAAGAMSASRAIRPRGAS